MSEQTPWTCAACRRPIPPGKEGIVVVAVPKRQANPDGRVSVYVHDDPDCRKRARA